MLSLSRKAFEELVEEALDEIPAEFRAQAKNVQVTVQLRPGPEAAGMEDPDLLLGLHLGPNLTETNSPANPGFPSRIILYQSHLMDACHDEGALKKQIALTLRHEFAHHLGFSDDDLAERWPEGA